MEFVYTKEAAMLEKWDNFVLHDNRGSHLLLSDWVFSYESYGFGTEFCLCMEAGEIVGGYAAVVAKVAFFKFYVVPFGPVLAKGYESHLDELVDEVRSRAKIQGACYAHVTIPASDLENPHTFTKLPELPSLKTANKGHGFKYVYGSSGLNWIDLRGFDEESKIMTLKPAVRRNIRNSYRKGLDFMFLETPETVEEGYR